MVMSKNQAIRKKRRFTYIERYAIWKVHGDCCWWCTVPLPLRDATVDHAVPESLLDDESELHVLLQDYGLPDDFNINSYENWMPCCHRCNSIKSKTPPPATPLVNRALQRMHMLAPDVEKEARSLANNLSKDHVFKTLFAALEERKITMHDLKQLLDDFIHQPTKAGVPHDVIILDNGYWVKRQDIVKEGICRCGLDACIGHYDNIYCYFDSSLSSWVVTTGLYWQCYDEIITCPRCATRHKRGHTGREGTCLKPYANQTEQTD